MPPRSTETTALPDTVFSPFSALHWRFLHHCPAGLVPAQWRPWLEDRGSLTRRLQTASGGNFAVQVLRQEFALPTASEARALDLAQRRWALIREVVLIGYDMPWVYARSVLPFSTLSGRLRHLRQLSNRPLGQVLFNAGNMRRDPVQIARLPSTALPEKLTAATAALDRPQPTLLWGRRSVFRVDDKPLLVAEFFLPGFDPYNTDYSSSVNRP